MRIVIAEDSTLLRDGLAHLLQRRGHHVPAAVADGDALITAVAEHHPDLVIVDVRMPPTFTDEGVRAALQLRCHHPSLAVLVLSQYIETRYAAELLASSAGHLGYLLKDRVTDVTEFLDALDRIAAGATVLDPEVVTQIMGASRRRGAIDTLTLREHDVLTLMAQGRTNSHIADHLHLSNASIEKHITSIFTKLGLPPSPADHRRVLAVLRSLESE